MESAFFEDVKQMMHEAALMFKESDRKFEAQKTANCLRDTPINVGASFTLAP